jgi:hypothetical protein
VSGDLRYTSFLSGCDSKFSYQSYCEGTGNVRGQEYNKVDITSKRYLYSWGIACSQTRITACRGQLNELGLEARCSFEVGRF